MLDVFIVESVIIFETLLLITKKNMPTQYEHEHIICGQYIS